MHRLFDIYIIINLLKLIFMEVELTFDEELAVSTAISLRIRDLTQSIEDCRPLGLDSHALREVRDTLKVAYRKLVGVDYKL